MAIAQGVIEEAVELYRRERGLYLRLAARVADICQVDIVNNNLVRAQVTSRTKTVDSFRDKLERFSRRPDKHMPTADEVFRQVADLAGVRIATYRPEDEARVAAEIQALFDWPNGVARDIERKDRLATLKQNYYRATHCQATLRAADLADEDRPLARLSCEIQVCSIMAHVWNEIEHDIGYKPTGGELGPEEQRLLGALGHLTRSGDEVIAALLDATAARLRAQTGPFHDAHDFVARLGGDLPGVDFSIGGGPLFGLLRSLDLTSPEALNSYVAPLKRDLAATLGRIKRFNADLAALGDADLSLDPATSDLLLMLLLEPFGEAIARRQSAGGAGGGVSRIGRIAAAYHRHGQGRGAGAARSSSR